MPLDIFALRNRVVGEYRAYAESFVHILDSRLDRFVRDELAKGRLWPEGVLQLNPAYALGPTLGELADAGEIVPETARFFGQGLRLYEHQLQALRIAAGNRPYVVTTGTGSGKSLTYLVPIVDRIFRERHEGPSVRALVVYPMNALINSQLKALQEFKARNWPDCPLTFDRHTGQDRGDRERRNAMLTDPPQIVLTNYVMLEYMLIRPTERVLLERMTAELAFLAIDELHVYRGRQGADVAMLLRRLQQLVRRPGLLVAGTSATIASGGDGTSRRRAVAEVGTRLFGVGVAPADVVGETLVRAATAPVPRGREALRAALAMPPPAPTVAAVTAHPLAAWIEAAFGLAEVDGRLERREPRTFADGTSELAREAGTEPEACAAALRAVLEAGSRAEIRPATPVLAFRLHQFLASGASFYATLEAPERRHLSAEPGFSLGEADGEARPRLLFPLAFCRECGQELYLVARTAEGRDGRLLPRTPELNAPAEEIPGTPGYLALETGDLWSEGEDLPDGWYEWRAAGPRVKPAYRPHVPERLWVTPDGAVSASPVAGAVEGWWQPRPLMLCPRCRASFELRQKSDFGKLVTLSQTGRSTATTILACAAVDGLDEARVDREVRKLLSFTDNRQDAALQAGHLNDFVLVVQLRGALVRALAEHGSLTFDRLGAALFDALALPPAAWMRTPVEDGRGFERARSAMIDLLEYLAIEDLGRAWRVAQPNLEQCGLLRIGYDGLQELAADAANWLGVPMLEAMPSPARHDVLCAILDHLRGALAIEAELLGRDRGDSLKRRVAAEIGEPWRFDENEQLRRAAIALLPGVVPEHRDGVTLGLGARSAIGRYLRSRRTWGIERELPGEMAESIALGVVDRLRGHLLEEVRHGAQARGVRLKVAALRWQPGGGRVPPPDPVRSRALHLRRKDLRHAMPNEFFTRLYRERAAALTGTLAGEHTGQVRIEKRLEREDAFGKGDLAVLCCSPTMELGVDIRELAVVHLRNVPPNPANYAQRSGRAGRSGRPALVLAFASDGNAHDRHYFDHPTAMIAGAVAPPRFDLANQELLEAHIHSLWMAAAGPELQQSIALVLDIAASDLPLAPDLAAAIGLSPARLEQLRRAAAHVAEACGPELARAPWFSSAWLDATVEGARAAFDRAFDRWRELYRAAHAQREAARRQLDRPGPGRDERDTARRRAQEAQRELDLLRNEGRGQQQGDFYPYRYLASEGFIPGYNFPRLPLRCLVAGAVDTEAVDRPRFLGLTEFGPSNLLYHEGRRHRIVATVLPTGDIGERLRSAKLCRSCGYAHAGDELVRDRCIFCDAQLDGSGIEMATRLLDQPTVRAQRELRISSEEEQRERLGYDVATHFHGGEALERRTARFAAPDGRLVLEATAVPRAELWRINHGWRHGGGRQGFALHRGTGRWVARDGDEAAAVLRGLKPLVTDRRNLLFVRPFGTGNDDATLKTLAYALRRAAQLVFQIEEQELAAELIGERAYRRILFWEAAEGGIGVAERMLVDAGAACDLARVSLSILHHDPETGIDLGQEAKGCAAACYACLLSYSNQIDHRHLDRRRITSLLRDLAVSTLVPEAGSRGYEEQYRWLCERVDPASGLERAFLDELYRRRLRLPDLAQHAPADDVAVQADFYYRQGTAPNACVFIDGSPHDLAASQERDEAKRTALRARGFLVIPIRSDAAVAEQLAAYRSIFAPVP